MAPDPISALSVAAAAIQFIQFSSHIVSKGRHIYNSSNGTTEENEFTETVTLRLKQLTSQLGVPSTNPIMANVPESEELKEVQKQIGAICTECTRLSKVLLDRLYALKVPTGAEHRKWKSFRHALKSVWSKQELDTLAERLRSLREELDTHMMFILRKTMGDMAINMDGVLKSLSKDTQRIISDLRKSQATQKSEIQKQFDQLTDYQRRQFEETRSVFVQKHVDVCKTRVQLQLLQSLRFAEMTHRAEAITVAHSQTFRWLFHDPKAAGGSWDSFRDWLTCNSGVYWVSGKAASGKSTLLRFIWDHHSTWSCLKEWASNGQLVAGAFYFWNSGAGEQRSHSGLLRSLLYAVLDKKRDLIATVFTEEWDQNCDLMSHDLQLAPVTWSARHLQNAFRRLMGLATEHMRFCFFIDGLDEYDGPAGDIAEYLYALSKENFNIKFCVSSRPWPIFEAVFENAPGLRLQDLTKDDIRAYVDDKLGQHPQLQNLRTWNPNEATALIEEVVVKAAGVFLWVELVIKSLIGGLRDGDEISHLRLRLADLPPDLENLYEHMLNRIEPVYRQESSKIFQIFRASDYSLDIDTLYRALMFSDAQQVVDMAFTPKAQGNMASAIKDENYLDAQKRRMMARLNSRTKGLLETQATRNTEDQGVSLQNPQRLKLFKPLSEFDLPEKSPEADALLEEYDRVVSHEGRPSVEHWTLDDSSRSETLKLRQHWGSDILSAAVICGLNWYFRPRLNSVACPVIVARQRNLPLPIGNIECRHGLPLLAYALGFHEWAVSGTAIKPDVLLVATLLGEGQNPNTIYRGFTIWQYTLHYVHIIKSLEKKRPDLLAWRNVFQLMLNHGADPHACCIEDVSLFAESTALSKEGDIGYNEPVVAKHSLYTTARHPLSSGKQPGISNHDQHHSVAAVVYDVFRATPNPEVDRLVEILEQKMRATDHRGKRRKRKRDRTDDRFSKASRWVS
ncbi:hypothetical protein SLS60_008442 [Paraconiothyrium brasiliense]|uniref:NACHT domain-containing protein n=1 Tax=Paraconiothyrium brasiliense TaxID=300254 RepID=A0ABR3R0L4_9PLEO